MSCFVELTDKDGDLKVLIDLYKVVLVTYLEDGTTKLETENIELEVHEGHKVVKELFKSNGMIYIGD
ncbi:Hypothetical protein DAL_108 [Psychrobacter phage D'Alembert]|nr:Hypothetical protein DAL_108 [Psychrobacter phage D'Alembert]